MRVSSRQRPAPSGYGVAAAAALTAIILGIGGTVWALGVEIPWLARKSPPSLAGLVPVPVLSQAAPAYARLSREHFFNVTTGKMSYIFLAPSEVRPEMIVDLSQLLGRVLSRDKREGYALSEADLLPPGTRAGLVAGIPAGKRSLVLDAGRVLGMHGLAAGDHFDLIATFAPPASVPARSRKDYLATSPLTSAALAPRTEVLVHDGVIIQPVTAREAAKLAANKHPRGVFEEATIAVGPDELVRLTEALAQEADIICVARSGRPDESGERIEIAPARREVRTIETMIGFDRQIVVVPEPAPSDRETSSSSQPPLAPPTKE